LISDFPQHFSKSVVPSFHARAGSAVAGTLLLEFGLLSHLSGDRRFFVAAHDALNAVWSLRSERDLVGNTLDVRSREWTNPNAGIGACVCVGIWVGICSSWVLPIGCGEFLNHVMILSRACPLHRCRH
jgi:mannosidase alpha-like ER degradation enhancer 1